MPSTYPPPGESPSDLWIERTNLNGSVLAGVSYGIHFTLYLIAVPLLFRKKSNKRDWGFLIFSTVMFALGTVFVASNTKVNKLAFIDNRNFPGGPTAWQSANYNTPVIVLGNAAGFVSNWLSDGLLIYRCLMIYSFNYWITLLPILVYLASVAMGIMVLVETGLPHSNLWTALSMKFILAYFSLSLSLNVCLTLLIAIRIFIHRQLIRKNLGAKHGTQYTSIIAMIVESSALYSAFNVLFLVTYARNSTVQNLFLPVLGNVQMISPLLIIIRVALGRGWSKDTTTVITGTKIIFKQDEGSNTTASKSGKQSSTAFGRDV